MKIYYGTSLIEINPQVTPVIIVFDDDNERMAVAEQIQNMAPKEAVRAYAQFPVGIVSADAATKLINGAVKKHKP